MKQDDHPLKMLVYDWYDGPAGGFMTLENGKSFCFFLLDWDSQHRVRIFALQATSAAIDEMVNQLTSETPEWPVWFPVELVHPSAPISGLDEFSKIVAIQP